MILSIGCSTICKCHVAWSQLRNTFSHPSGQWYFCEISAPWNPSEFPSYIDNHSCLASGENKKKKAFIKFPWHRFCSLLTTLDHCFMHNDFLVKKENIEFLPSQLQNDFLLRFFTQSPSLEQIYRNCPMKQLPSCASCLLLAVTMATWAITKVTAFPHWESSIN